MRFTSVPPDRANASIVSFKVCARFGSVPTSIMNASRPSRPNAQYRQTDTFLPFSGAASRPVSFVREVPPSTLITALAGNSRQAEVILTTLVGSTLLKCTDGIGD